MKINIKTIHEKHTFKHVLKPHWEYLLKLREELGHIGITGQNAYHGWNFTLFVIKKCNQIQMIAIWKNKRVNLDIKRSELMMEKWFAHMCRNALMFS